jgi:hypothetical protein
VSEGLAELELELRLLPGVVNVGFGPEEDGGHIGISVVTVEPDPDLELVATRVARGFRAAATVEIVDLCPERVAAPVPVAVPVLMSEERVALVESRFDVASGESRVVLSWMGNSANGIGTSGVLIGPAEATLSALASLGIGLEARLASVSSAQSVGENPPVRVILRAERGDAEFVGVARAASEPESAARATLAAFNRYVGGRGTRFN